MSKPIDVVTLWREHTVLFVVENDDGSFMVVSVNRYDPPFFDCYRWF